jgi:spore coat protein U-like protein
MNHKIKTKILFIIMLLFSANNIGYTANSAVAVNATVVSRNAWCSFSSGTLSLNFGILNPANSTPVSVSTSVNFNCYRFFQPTVFSITDDGGLYETGPNIRRMRNTTHPSEYLPYGLTLNPTTGTLNFWEGIFGSNTLTITGTVLAADYQNAFVGDYNDTVTITIAP